MNSETKLEAVIKELDSLILDMEKELEFRETDEKQMWDFDTIVRLRTSINHLKASKEKMNLALDTIRKTVLHCRENQGPEHCIGKTLLFEYLSKGDKDAFPYTEVYFKMGKKSYRADIVTKIGGKWNIIEIETRIHSPQCEEHIKDMIKLRNNLTEVKFPHGGAPDIEDLKDQIRNGEAIFHVGYTAQIDDFFAKTIKEAYGKQINLNLFFVDTKNKTVTKI